MMSATEQLKLLYARHLVEARRPVSCTEAASVYEQMLWLRRRVACQLAGCRAHVTDEENRYCEMDFGDLVELANRSGVR